MSRAYKNSTRNRLKQLSQQDEPMDDGFFDSDSTYATGLGSGGGGGGRRSPSLGGGNDDDDNQQQQLYYFQQEQAQPEYGYERGYYGGNDVDGEEEEVLPPMPVELDMFAEETRSNGSGRASRSESIISGNYEFLQQDDNSDQYAILGPSSNRSYFSEDAVQRQQQQQQPMHRAGRTASIRPRDNLGLGGGRMDSASTNQHISSSGTFERATSKKPADNLRLEGSNGAQSSYHRSSSQGGGTSSRPARARGAPDNLRVAGRIQMQTDSRDNYTAGGAGAPSRPSRRHEPKGAFKVGDDRRVMESTSRSAFRSVQLEDERDARTNPSKGKKVQAVTVDGERAGRTFR